MQKPIFTRQETLVLLTCLLLLAAFLKIKPGGIPKCALHRIYGIDPKTFAKWIALFCPDLIGLADYIRRRKLPPYLAFAIALRLGFPGSDTPVLGKRQIVESAEGSYRALRESIRRFPERFGIEPVAFKILHVFPPEIARQMREQFG